MTLRVVATPLRDVAVLQAEPARDMRGSFTRLFCRTTLAAQGIDIAVRQTSVSHSHRRGTLRGLHFQAPPFAEAKIVHCVAGAVLDVVLDLRPTSPSFRRSFGIALHADSGRGVFVPPGCAHGVLTLTDDAVVLYEIDQDYQPDHAGGVRWDDPVVDVAWPLKPTLVSERDSCWPDFAP